MADLRDDILNEEEQYGGFTPGEPDDDTFLLQDKSYPGNKFSFLNPHQNKVAIEGENNSIDEASNNDTSKQNFNDSFENTKKNNRKKFALIPIITAVALLLLTTTALLFLIPENPYGLFSFKSESDDLQNLKTDKQINDSISESENISYDSLLAENTEVMTIDTVTSIPEIIIGKNASEIIENDAENKNLPEISKQISGNSIEQKSSTATVESKVIEQPRKIDAKQTFKTNTTSNIKPNDKFTTTKVDDRTYITNDIAEMKPDKKDESEILREKALSETYVPKDVPGIYIVQIYSSPSKEDAQAWLDKLKSKNIPEAFISEQNVRDKIWYRVRFGKYSTREEARNAALRYGFAQTWIDRVK